MVDQESLLDLSSDERERAYPARRHPHRAEALRQAWLAWNDTVPAVPEDAR